MGDGHKPENQSNVGAKRRVFSDEEIKGLKDDWLVQSLAFCACVVGMFASGYWASQGVLDVPALIVSILVCLVAAHAACFLSVRESMSMLGLPGLTLPSYIDGCIGSAAMITAMMSLVLFGGFAAGSVNDLVLRCISFALLAGTCGWGLTVPAAFSKKALEAAYEAIEKIELMARNGQLDEYMDERREG